MKVGLSSDRFSLGKERHVILKSFIQSVRSKRLTLGFSFAELMIASLVGAVLVACIMYYYVSTNKTLETLRIVNRRTSERDVIKKILNDAVTNAAPLGIQNSGTSTSDLKSNTPYTGAILACIKFGIPCGPNATPNGIFVNRYDDSTMSFMVPLPARNTLASSPTKTSLTVIQPPSMPANYLRAGDLVALESGLLSDLHLLSADPVVGAAGTSQLQLTFTAAVSGSFIKSMLRAGGNVNVLKVRREAYGVKPGSSAGTFDFVHLAAGDFTDSLAGVSSATYTYDRLIELTPQGVSPGRVLASNVLEFVPRAFPCLGSNRTAYYTAHPAELPLSNIPRCYSSAVGQIDYRAVDTVSFYIAMDNTDVRKLNPTQTARQIAGDVITYLYRHGDATIQDVLPPPNPPPLPGLVCNQTCDAHLVPPGPCEVNHPEDAQHCACWRAMNGIPPLGGGNDVAICCPPGNPCSTECVRYLNWTPDTNDNICNQGREGACCDFCDDLQFRCNADPKCNEFTTNPILFCTKCKTYNDDAKLACCSGAEGFCGGDCPEELKCSTTAGSGCPDPARFCSDCQNYIATKGSATDKEFWANNCCQGTPEQRCDATLCGYGGTKKECDQTICPKGSVTCHPNCLTAATKATNCNKDACKYLPPPDNPGNPFQFCEICAGMGDPKDYMSMCCSSTSECNPPSGVGKCTGAAGVAALGLTDYCKTECGKCDRTTCGALVCGSGCQNNQTKCDENCATEVGNCTCFGQNPKKVKYVPYNPTFINAANFGPAGICTLNGNTTKEGIADCALHIWGWDKEATYREICAKCGAVNVALKEDACCALTLKTPASWPQWLKDHPDLKNLRPGTGWTSAGCHPGCPPTNPKRGCSCNVDPAVHVCDSAGFFCAAGASDDNTLLAQCEYGSQSSSSCHQICDNDCIQLLDNTPGMTSEWMDKLGITDSKLLGRISHACVCAARGENPAHADACCTDLTWDMVEHNTGLMDSFFKYHCGFCPTTNDNYDHEHCNACSNPAYYCAHLNANWDCIDPNEVVVPLTDAQVCTCYAGYNSSSGSHDAQLGACCEALIPPSPLTQMAPLLCSKCQDTASPPPYRNGAQWNRASQIADTCSCVGRPPADTYCNPTCQTNVDVLCRCAFNDLNYYSTTYDDHYLLANQRNSICTYCCNIPEYWRDPVKANPPCTNDEFINNCKPGGIRNGL